MKYSVFLRNHLLNSDQDDAQGMKNVVFRYGVPELVSLVYREHVQAWFGMEKLSRHQRAAHDMVTEWLRRLETGYQARLFNATPRLDATWWDGQHKAIARRRNSSRRVTLPLQDEIRYCVNSLKPHYVVWLLQAVDSRKLELAMYPRCLLEIVHRLVNLTPDEEYQDLVMQCQSLYPNIDAFGPQDLKGLHFPYYRVATWPGLRLCPPFFPELMALHPPPQLKRQVSYFIFHAHMEESHAVATMKSSHVSVIDTIHTSQKPSQGMVSIQQMEYHHATKYLHILNGIHPRSFDPTSPHSPYAMAAKELTPVHGVGLGKILKTQTPGSAKLPENVFDSCETGFSFTYMQPRLVGGVTWSQEESFYEVKYRDETFHISSFTGLGMRLRLRLLDLCKAHDLKGKGVAIVVPDGLDQETTENVMLTCIGWLRDLGLNDIQLLAESKCNAMCLGAIAHAAHKHWPALWTSIHDGALVCTILGIEVHDKRLLRDLWGNKYFTEPLHSRLLEKLRDFVMNNASIQASLEPGSKVWKMTTLAESMRLQLPILLRQLDKQTEWPVSYEFEFIDHNISSVTLEITETTYHDWMVYTFQQLADQPWWDSLTEQLEMCKGVLLSGGVFDTSPRTSLEMLTSHFKEKAKHVTKTQRLHVMHGAAMAIYEERGCREITLKHSANNDKFCIGTLKSE